MKLYALHGFLGKPDDWNIIFRDHAFERYLNPVSLFQHNQILSLKAWGKHFNSQIDHANEKNIIMGYSMGGRLALHALVDNPIVWKGAIIISAHPGLELKAEIQEREHSDRLWATRFAHENWDLLMTDWNKNPIFKNDPFHFVRKETDFNRKALIHALTEWSLSKQENMLRQVAEINLPILWIAGEKDPQLVSIKKLTLKDPFSKIWIEQGVGHRVPWQKPEQFLLQLTEFIGKL